MVLKVPSKHFDFILMVWIWHKEAATLRRDVKLMLRDSSPR